MGRFGSLGHYATLSFIVKGKGPKNLELRIAKLLLATGFFAL